MPVDQQPTSIFTLHQRQDLRWSPPSLIHWKVPWPVHYEDCSRLWFVHTPRPQCNQLLSVVSPRHHPIWAFWCQWTIHNERHLSMPTRKMVWSQYLYHSPGTTKCLPNSNEMATSVTTVFQIRWGNCCLDDIGKIGSTREPTSPTTSNICHGYKNAKYISLERRHLLEIYSHSRPR